MVGIHIAVGVPLIALNAAAGLLGGIAWYRNRASIPFWYLLRAAQVSVFLQALLGGLLVVTGHEPEEDLHYLYGILPLFVSFIAEGARLDAAQREVGDLDPKSLTTDDPAIPRPRHRPPRDGHHGRQLRSHLLPRVAGGWNQRPLTPRRSSSRRLGPL